MKILLDENLPRKLRFVQEMRWNGKKNSEVLQLMTGQGFQVFITLDKGLRFEQELSKYPVTVFLLVANDSRVRTLEPLVAKIASMVSQGSLQHGLIEIEL